MLLSLSVKNFAIIDNIQIDFKDGMTAFTGETGAGKSLIIDAIGLLLGDRASLELVRFGETKATIEGVFCNIPQELYNILLENELVEPNIFNNSTDDNLDEVLTIRKEIYSNGKSVSKINGNSVSSSFLNSIAFYLGNIHTQFDTYKLINPKFYFDYIDNDDINILIKNYKENLKEYNKYLKEYNTKKNIEDEIIKKLDYLKYQFDELTKAKLNVNEEEELINKHNILKNHEKIFSNYHEFIDYVDKGNILSNLYQAINSLSKNTEYEKSLAEKVEKLNSCYYEIDDLLNDVQSIINHDDFDESEIDSINERLSLYQSLHRKYKMTTSDLIDYMNKLSNEIEEIENFDVFLDEIIKKKDEYYHKTFEIANNISKIRIENAKNLESELINNLLDLELKNVSLNIKVDTTDSFLSNGINTVDILVSFNKGESVKPLSKIASGGELSRFMLALKSITCTKQRTYIFDEIDTGVSGEIAQKIGEKIKKIAKTNQVICVTHLPQVGALCDNHIFISKEVVDDKTITNIKELNFDERVDAIALMLSKGNVTPASKALALELLSK